MNSQRPTRRTVLLASFAGLPAAAIVLAGITAFATPNQRDDPASANTAEEAPHEPRGRVHPPGLEELEKAMKQMQREAESAHRRIEKRARRIMDRFFDVPEPGGIPPATPDECEPPHGFGPPKEFGVPKRFGPPKEFFKMPGFEGAKPYSYSHSSHYSTGSSWSHANGKFRYVQSIAGLQVTLKGSVAGCDLAVEAIEIEPRPGEILRYTRMDEVPSRYRDEVEAVVQAARRHGR